MKITLILGALVIYSNLALCDAEPIKLSGTFDNVESKDSGVHCGGYSITLWREGVSFLGLLDQHAGLCGDPPCGLLEELNYNSHSKMLTFKSRIDGQNFRFTGSIHEDEVVGMLNEEKIRLRKQGNLIGGDYRNLTEWCSRWSTVPRCSGVKQFCEHAITNDASG